MNKAIDKMKGELPRSLKPPVRSIILGMVQPNPGLRYGSVQEVLEDLRALYRKFRN